MKLRGLLVPWLWVLVFGPKLLFGSPTITSFTPTVGTNGDSIWIYGSGFTSGGIAVYFWNGHPASGVINSDIQITVTVPSGIATGPIGIQQNGGAINYTAADFTAIGSGPYISDFSPLFGAVNDLVTINGAHLTNSPMGSPVIKFNGTNGTSVTVNASGTQATARVPTGATSGPLTVTTSKGVGSAPANFTVIGPGPYITGFSPILGGASQQVLVDGVHFQTGNATNASFGGAFGTGFAVTSDTRLQVTTPANVASGPITVYSALGNSTTISNFYVAPRISSFSPSSGRAGTNVTITGANFLGATSVTFNGVAAASFTVVNNTTIRAVAPSNVTDGLIRVFTPVYSCFSASNFGVLPLITGFSPTLGPVGTSVLISGANFNVGTPSVRFNGTQAAPPTGVTFSQLTAMVPAGATTGPLTVTTADGTAASLSNFMLPPALSSFSPNAGAAGTRITVIGQNFLGATGLSFNGTPVAAFNVTNNTTLGATVPAGVVTGPLSITTPAGAATSTAVFYGVPGITSFTPTHGTNGTVVTISGTNLFGATAVRFNGFSAGINSNDGYQLVTSVPAGAQAGPLSVVTPGGTSTTTAIFSIDHPSDLQIWGTPSQNPATLGSNLVYTITLANYGPNDAANVKLTNLLPASVTLKSATINQGTLATNSNPLIGTLGTMIWGDVVTLTITVVPRSLGSITNTMSLGSDNPDPAPGNNITNITTLVQSPALLSLQLLTNQVRVSWPADLTNYNLQGRGSLATNLYWSNITTAPIVSGGQLSITESLSRTSRFYRLHR